MSRFWSPQQVIRDVDGGFRYTAATEAAEVEVTVDTGVLYAGGKPLTDIELADTADGTDLITHRSDEWLVEYWEQLIIDGFQYRQHRRPPR